jgi:uncharacterized phage protein gp47/JayE
MASSSQNTYTSQQATILASMVAYLQNPANWPNGVPLVTDYTPGSVVYTLLSAVSVAVDALGLAIFMARLAAYISTAVGVDLDNKVADFGLQRNAAVPATGTVTFAKNTAAAADISIPAGSLVSTVPTSSSSAVSYFTQDDATLSIGQTTVDVAVTAQVAGSGSNLAAGAQLLLSSMIPGIDGATLGTSITSGADEETDDALRSRGLAAFQALAHGTITSYQQIVLAVAGVAGAVVVPQNRGPGTVDIYIMGANNSIPSVDVQTEAQLAINAQKVATDDVQVLLPTTTTVSATLSVHLAAGYDPDATATAVQEAVSAYIESLGIGAGIYGYTYASHLVAAALDVVGVLNATTTFVDTAILPQQMPLAGTITVNII